MLGQNTLEFADTYGMHWHYYSFVLLGMDDNDSFFDLGDFDPDELDKQVRTRIFCFILTFCYLLVIQIMKPS